MNHLIHKNYKTFPTLGKKEADNLYESLKGFSYDDIMEAAQKMYEREGIPLDKNWETFEEFHIYFVFFSELAKEIKKQAFIDLLTSGKEDERSSKFFNIPEITSHEKLVIEACALLGFIDTMDEFFNYEVNLRSLGYGFNEENSLRKQKDIKKKKKSGGK